VSSKHGRDHPGEYGISAENNDKLTLIQEA
jgi:hypothetical protein